MVCVKHTRWFYTDKIGSSPETNEHHDETRNIISPKAGWICSWGGNSGYDFTVGSCIGILRNKIMETVNIKKS